MKFGDPTTPDAIYAAVVTKLGTTDAVLDAAAVFPTLARDEDIAKQAPGSDRFVTLRLKAFRGDMAWKAGGGRTLCKYDGTIDVDLWCRCDLDQALRATDFMGDATAGVLPLWRRLLKSLEQFAPTNSAGNCILTEPTRNLSFDLAARPLSGGWTKFGSVWECKFLYDLS